MSLDSDSPMTDRAVRDVAVDVVRGLCILSMAFGHLGTGSLGFRVTHAAVWVDGAVGFVFLSGLVLGITQRRTVDQRGVRVAARKMLRRTRLIYLGHIGLCVVAMVVVQTESVRSGLDVGVADLGGPLPGLGSLLLLRVNPVNASILSLYVVMMLLGLVAIRLLRGGVWTVLLGTSLLLYAAGTRWPGTFSFSFSPGVPGAVNWATWQFLFMLAVATGWHWDGAWIIRLRTSRPVLMTSTLVVVGLGGLGHLATDPPITPWKYNLGSLFSDGTLGPGRILLALAFTVVIYRLAGVLVARAGQVAAPMATIGRRSLDCYLILGVVVIAAPGLIHYRYEGAAANLVVLAVLLLCWAWCSMRDLRGVRTRAIADAKA